MRINDDKRYQLRTGTRPFTLIGVRISSTGEVMYLCLYESGKSFWNLAYKIIPFEGKTIGEIQQSLRFSGWMKKLEKEKL